MDESVSQDASTRPGLNSTQSGVTRQYPGKNSMSALTGNTAELNSAIAENSALLPRVAQEGSPEAEKLQANREKLLEDRKGLTTLASVGTGPVSGATPEFSKRTRVYHTRKKENCLCLEDSKNGRVHVISLSSGRDFIANTKNLRKAK